MNQIKFSHNYPKLHNQNKATLLDVRIISYYHLHSDLIEYDTKNSKGEYYPLPKTNLIHLTFIGNKLIPFCTLRRHTTQKFSYYKNKIGEEFIINLHNVNYEGGKK